MDLGQRIKEARLEAGLSQRQLCGDTITRNMLSLIENGGARPSMDTLRFLAERLCKPISYFLDEQAIVSPNQACMEAARTALPRDIPEILNGYQGPDPMFDWEKYYIEALAYLTLAQDAISSRRLPYGSSLLEKAKTAGAKTPYYTQELERKRLILCYQCNYSHAGNLAQKLPDNAAELLLRAEAALQQGNPSRCSSILEAAEIRSQRWHYLKAEAALAQKDYGEAASHYLLCEESPLIFGKLETCYKQLGDFQKAYEYACRQLRPGRPVAADNSNEQI